MSRAAIVEQPFNPNPKHLNQPTTSTAVVRTPAVSSPLHEDIIALVFSEFNTWQPAERAACGRGALVCRTWAEPASKALWRSLRSLLPLYGILLPVPQVVRKTYIGNFHGSHVPLSYIEYIGEIVKTSPFHDPAVWSSFMRCASRIRQLIDWDPRFDLRILRALCHHNGGDTVLPVLRTLSWADTKSSRSDEALALFAPPSLQHLAYHINSETPAEFVRDTLTNLVPKAPFLSSLKIVVVARMTTRLPLLPFLWKFQRLRRLSFLGYQVVTPSCLTGFLSFPTLEHLECNIEGFEACQNARHPIDVPNLLELRITGTGASMRGLLRTLRAPRLQDLLLNAREQKGEPAHDAHRDLFRDMPTAPFARSLQKFSYHSGLPDCGPPHHKVHPNRMSFLDLIHPLLSLRQLRRVSIICHWEEVALKDEEVLAAAEAWRDVEELMLAPLDHYQEPLVNRSHRPTPLCLPHLRRLCPNISFLALPIDMEAPNASVPSHDIQSQNFPPHRLKRFDILGYRSLTTSQEDLEALARYLKQAFPDLEPCAPFAISKDPWDSMWSTLRSLQESERDLVNPKTSK